MSTAIFPAQHSAWQEVSAQQMLVGFCFPGTFQKLWGSQYCTQTMGVGPIAFNNFIAF